jgi:hypothetical protein
VTDVSGCSYVVVAMTTCLGVTVIVGAKKSAPWFLAIAQINTPNIVIVTPVWEIQTNGDSLEGCMNIIDVKRMI